MITKGEKFEGPNGQGYEATRDIHVGQVARADDFKAFGGAPVPSHPNEIPSWLVDQLTKRRLGPT